MKDKKELLKDVLKTTAEKDVYLSLDFFSIQVECKVR